ncbi:hypothetical protein FPOAC2_04380 [Fusarium poae]|uniref:hypothetical protein n=1 Tax=Fusarium poae TaxID=36050 RepID=UPI001CE893BB|nr:hypothetical protein FPOAC1_004299 [Fusarium poae]KAG8671062.1 hypothetical protein FPOAC1_004299 [Fusarium poae]
MDHGHPTPFTSEANRVSAIRRFHQIITYFENNNDDIKIGYYDKLKIVKFTYEYACNQSSKDLLVLVALGHMGVLYSSDDNVDLENATLRDALQAGLNRFANLLLEAFFLPLKASTGEMAQRSPPYNLDIVSEGDSHTFSEMLYRLHRLHRLQRVCLMRDQHRCVISGVFDAHEAFLRYRTYGERCVDDDGKRLYGPIPNSFDKLEIAQILPHSFFFQRGSFSRDLESGKCMQRAILNMIHHGLFKTIEDASPKNALTLSASLHQAFSQFRIFFDPVEGEEDTYEIKAFPPGIRGLPVKRKLSVFYGEEDDLPDPGLLAAHRAIGHILHLSTTSPSASE